MRIVYKKRNGRAIDLRFVDSDYILEPGEIEYREGDELPDIETLHDPEYRLKRQKEEELEDLRRQYSTTLLEKIIEALLTKNIINLSDLPQEAQNIITRKRQLEQELNNT